MRCFVGVPLPDAVLDRLEDLDDRIAGLGADLRPVARVDRHVTLKFLGDVDRRQVDAIARAVRDEDWPRPRLQLGAVGQFPPRGVPRVVWVRFTGEVDGWRDAAARLERIAATAGVPREERPFHAHVTLARLRSPLGVSRLQAALREQAIAPDPVAFTAAGPVLWARREDAGRGRGPSYDVLAASHER